MRLPQSLLASLALLLCFATRLPAQDLPPITFNRNFEGASLGKIEPLSPTTFRCFVEGQYDQRGHNRQTSWFYFRMDHTQGREITLTLTDLVGEYNDKPGACPMGPDVRPVFSNDGENWQYFPDDAFSWDDQKKEVTLKFKPQGDSIWIAHVPPYTPHNLQGLLNEVDRSPHAVIETIGKTAQGRDLKLITVTDPSVPDAQKKVIWLQARQHAWEAGTSYVEEGALRFAISDDPQAIDLRRKIIFKFTPMIDPDGCATGKVRFNANGYDVNRHWSEVDLRSKELLKLMPEIWYTKKAIVNAGHIDLMVNLHNTETGEYLGTQASEDATLKIMQRFFDLLVQQTTFDPAKKLELSKPSSDTNSLVRDHHVPVMLMEQRIATGKKLGHRPTIADRLAFGKQLIVAMANTVLE